MPILSPEDIDRRVLPALLTLASENDSNVQRAVIGAFGRIYSITNQTNILNKVNTQMETFLVEAEDKANFSFIIIIWGMLDNYIYF